MRFLISRKSWLSALILLIAISVILTPAVRIDAADHGDAPFTAHEVSADLNDLYLFRDPNDNSRVVLIMSVNNFIVPGENSNFGIFDASLRYRFEIENTGDFRPDTAIDVRFTSRVAVGGVTQPQIATINLPGGRSFTAPSTNSSNTADVAPTPVVTTDQASGVMFFAGLVDDPFFFDIPAFGRFNASIRAGAPNPGVFSRGRDSFAGYNVMAIALSVPISLIRGSGNEIGVIMETQRRSPLLFNTITENAFGNGPWVNVDRMGNPGVNVALVPFNSKNAYNAANPTDDAKGRFAPGIVGILQNFYGTDSTSIGILAGVAVTRGDILRLDITVPNTGTNPEAAFPNGRRLTDDVIDTLLFLINNRKPLGDNVNANELPFRSTFPFLAGSHQPRVPGTTDDATRN